MAALANKILPDGSITHRAVGTACQAAVRPDKSWAGWEPEKNENNFLTMLYPRARDTRSNVNPFFIC